MVSFTKKNMLQILSHPENRGDLLEKKENLENEKLKLYKKCTLTYNKNPERKSWQRNESRQKTPAQPPTKYERKKLKNDI